MHNEDDIVYRLRKRAEIRRQIPTRKSVEEGKPDRLSELLEEAATEIERLRHFKKLSNLSEEEMNNSWIVTVEEDEYGDVIIPLGESFMEKYGWQMGDKLTWELTDNGAIITNVSAKERELNGGLA